ncbi:MAG TPA: CAP domain-containing protein [Acidothermaceae bacterium]|nr:CAP domain-containing protein [Acidothermaceae bacterium]
MLLTAPASTPRRRPARTWLAAVGTVAAAAVAIGPALVLAASPASASSSPASSLVAATNQARAAAGIAPLEVSGDLAAVATRQAHNMAASGQLYHTPGLGSAVCCWVVLGENVGEGPSAARLQAAFMASADHRANILRTSFTQIGIGYAIDQHGTLWVSEVFRRPSGTVTAAKQVAAVIRPTTVSTPQSVKKSTVKVAPPVIRPPVAAVAAVAPVTPAVPVSRDLVRLPLAAAQQLAAQLASGGVVTGTNPVSRLLDFAALASGAGN